MGKHTGDAETVERVKKILGYVDSQWKGGDESARWDSKEEKPLSKDEG